MVAVDSGADLVYSDYYLENTIKNKRNIIQAPCIGKNKTAFNEISKIYSVGLLTLLIKKNHIMKLAVLMRIIISSEIMILCFA